ncbi:DUF6463 family protein [Streptomyces sp. DSM 44917]|uniref:DUF6463 family protein n=1 Tax=Streptomyces boetiae TaxID=3075541 RepID=A0ABU2L290_9ACTN|nr:DUF6463 family protein [Streptomyces sp. DSM 44917]MDT0305378.1 DUF6463 family protein [Streptomyces sp. DSM 44917]
MPRPLVGPLLGGIAALHVAAVAVFYDGGAGEILRAGVIDGAPDAPEEPDAAFWYLCAGLLLAALGALVWRAERAQARAVPAWLGWSLIGVGLAGALVKPASPFLVFVLVGVLALRRRPARAARPGTPPVAGR